MSRLREALAAALLSLACIATKAAGAPAEDTVADFRPRAAEAFRWGDFAELQRLQHEAMARRDRSAEGVTASDCFSAGLGGVFNGEADKTPPYFEQVERQTRRWVDDNPQSTLAHALYVRALYARALNYRGSGYTSMLTEQARRDFDKQITRAVDHLAAHSTLMFRDSTTHVYALMVGRSVGWPQAQLHAIALDGLAKGGRDDAIYEELLVSLLPKWGGSPEAIDAWVREAVERTRATRGTELYAVLYRFVADELAGGLFTRSAANWPKFKQAYGELVAKYPDPIHLNRYARVACIAQDKATSAELLAKIGDAPRLSAWAWGSDGVRNHESCKRWVRGG